MKVFNQSTFEKWQIEDNSIQAIITSPPYYSLRRYDIPDVVIGGDPLCEHEYGNEIVNRKRGSIGSASTLMGGLATQEDCDRGTTIIKQGRYCILCNAWQGQYGLEPDFKLYIEHTLLWAKEAWRVLRDDGVFFLNIADSYNSSSAQIGRQDKLKYGGKSGLHCLRGGNAGYPSKCQLLIPERVSIMMVDELGLTLRNKIIWVKSNAMPESVTDRFSKRYEFIYFFTKKPKYYFNLDTVREEHAEATKQRVKYPKGKNPGDVWIIPTQSSSEKHRAMWPEKLVERMILCSTKAGDTVLDPFAGSGTTVLVAERLNRQGIGIDLGYSDIQARRLTEIQKELIL